MSEENIEGMEDEEIVTAVANRKEFEKKISSAWGYSSKGIEAKKAAMSMLSTKTGMYSRIPLLCKGNGCPYCESCVLLQYDLSPYGEACPVETAQIELFYEEYKNDFNLEDGSFTDKVLVKDLINYEILLERCKSLLQTNGVLVEDVIAGVSESGDAFYRPEVSKHWEAYERIQKKRNEIYNLMIATRKDKNTGKSSSNDHSMSSMLDSILANEDFIVEEKPNTIDVDYTD